MIRRLLTSCSLLVCFAASASDAECLYTENFCLRDSCVTFELPDAGKDFTAEICVGAKSNKESDGRSNVSWGVSWDSADGGIDVTVGWGNKDFGSPFDSRYLELVVNRRFPDGRTEEKLSRRLEKNVALNNGDNTIVFVASDSVMRLFMGHDELDFIGAVDIAGYPTVARICADGAVDVDYFVYKPSDIPDLSTEWNLESLKDYFSKGGDAVEGFWKYFDRDNDTDYARLGGEYVVAIVKNGDGGYDIIYVSDASVNSHRWHGGMLKGRLRATAFEGRYDLQWFDSELKPVDLEIFATLEKDVLLTFSFPLYKSKFRFAKIRD